MTKTCTESPHALASALGEPEVEPAPSRPGAAATGTNAPSGMSHSWCPRLRVALEPQLLKTFVHWPKSTLLLPQHAFNKRNKEPGMDKMNQRRRVSMANRLGLCLAVLYAGVCVRARWHSVVY